MDVLPDGPNGPTASTDGRACDGGGVPKLVVPDGYVFTPRGMSIDGVHAFDDVHVWLDPKGIIVARDASGHEYAFPAKPETGPWAEEPEIKFLSNYLSESTNPEAAWYRSIGAPQQPMMLDMISELLSMRYESQHAAEIADSNWVDGVVVGDRWTPDAITGEWGCGDLRIVVETDDPTRYLVSTVGGRHFFGGNIPDSCSRFGTFTGFRALWEYSAEEDVPTAGLESWFEAAQEQADAAYEEEVEKIRAAREEWEASRVGRTAAQLLAETPEDPDYFIPGFLAAGWAVKLAGREKGGKGTLVFYCLGKLERNEDTCFGPGPGRPVTSVIVTEEPMESVREKVERFGLERARIIYGWELSQLSWPDKVTRIVTEAIEDGHSVVFVDNVSRSAQIEDENGTEMARAVELLQDACRKAGLTLHDRPPPQEGT